MGGALPPQDTSADGVGLCASCVHSRRVESDRGSVFYRCALAERDPRYPKYPRLPVLRCAGYEPGGDATKA